MWRSLCVCVRFNKNQSFYITTQFSSRLFCCNLMMMSHTHLHKMGPQTWSNHKPVSSVPVSHFASVHLSSQLQLRDAGLIPASPAGSRSSICVGLGLRASFKHYISPALSCCVIHFLFQLTDNFTFSWRSSLYSFLWKCGNNKVPSFCCTLSTFELMC